MSLRSRALMVSRTPRGLRSFSSGAGDLTMRSTERLRTRSGVTNSSGASLVLCYGRML